jgi:hypothetical protein
MAWVIDGCISMQNLDIVRGDNRIAMIDCDNEALSDGDIVANARLIAAAPDLLAALIELDAWAIHGSGTEYPQGTFEAVRAAISKAIGEAS